MKEYLDLFKALSDQTRLRIVVLLLEKELCVCQLETALGISQSKVSRHLSVLKNAGIVKTRRDGLWIYYSIEEPKNKVEENLFKSLKKYLSKEKVFSIDLSNIKKCIALPIDEISKMTNHCKNVDKRRK